MGYACWHKLRWNGKKMVSNKVFEEKTKGDYKTPEESLIEEISTEKLTPNELLKRNDFQQL